MLCSTNTDRRNNKIYLLYIISTKNLNNVTFYADPIEDKAIYTYDKISYKCVISIRKFRVTEHAIYEYITKDINEMYNIKVLRTIL